MIFFDRSREAIGSRRCSNGKQPATKALAGREENIMSGPENVGKCREGYVRLPVNGATQVTFKMGSEKGGSDERSVHNVTISTMCMKKTEVTNAEYECPSSSGKGASKFQVVTTDCSPQKRERSSCSSGDNQPAVDVSWYDADRYCNSIGGRLPTEAEWEYAASVGGKHVFGTKHGTEEKLKNEACFDKNETCDVEKYPPNEFGLYGMAGNVWEWVNDWYGDYPKDHVVDPTGPKDGRWKVMRGGPWGYYHSYYLRAANRDFAHPDFGFDIIGFRCVVPPRTEGE